MKSRIIITAALSFLGFLSACSHQKPATTTAGALVIKPHSHIPIHTHTSVDRNQFFIPPLKFPGEWTVEDTLQTYGLNVANRLDYYFTQAKVSYPPKEIIFIAFKQEKKLELWARDNGEFRLIRDYFIMAASGDSGPKLRRGDRQVPEGIYRIEELNPNSHYHLSMKLNYPNEFDRFHAAQEGRTDPGSDIFIHGKAASIGCLAMGDESIEELFVLTAKTGLEKVKVIIAPHDPRIYPLVANSEDSPEWIPELYSIISREIDALSKIAKSAKPSPIHLE